MTPITLKLMGRGYTLISSLSALIRVYPRPKISIVIGVVEMAPKEKGNRLCNRM